MTRSAYRYSSLKDGMTVYVTPTDKGVATIACEAPVDADCERVASTLAVNGAKVLPLEPVAGLASALGDALSDLDRAGADGTHALRAADTPRGQSRAADRTRSAFARVAGAYARSSPGRPRPPVRERSRALCATRRPATSGWRAPPAAATAGATTPPRSPSASRARTWSRHSDSSPPRATRT